MPKNSELIVKTRNCIFASVCEMRMGMAQEQEEIIERKPPRERFLLEKEREGDLERFCRKIPISERKV